MFWYDFWSVEICFSFVFSVVEHCCFRILISLSIEARTNAISASFCCSSTSNVAIICCSRSFISTSLAATVAFRSWMIASNSASCSCSNSSSCGSCILSFWGTRSSTASWWYGCCAAMHTWMSSAFGRFSGLLWMQRVIRSINGWPNPIALMYCCRRTNSERPSPLWGSTASMVGRGHWPLKMWIIRTPYEKTSISVL